MNFYYDEEVEEEDRGTYDRGAINNKIPVYRNKPAPPSEFSGDRAHGRAFLNSCQLYLRLACDNFVSETEQVSWALSFMTTGRAALFVDRVLRFEAKNHRPRYETWTAFRQAFIAEFCPKNEAQDARILLETCDYFQGSRATEEYIDEFQDLVERAGYSDKTMTVLKFRHGLQSAIQDQLAHVLRSEGDGVEPEEWYAAAMRLTENVEANALLHQSSAQGTGSSVSHSVDVDVQMAEAPPFLEIPSDVAPMDIDAMRKVNASTAICSRCQELGHGRLACPRRFDVRHMSAKECQSWVKQLRKREEREALKNVKSVGSNKSDGNGAPSSAVNSISPIHPRGQRNRTKRWERSLPKTYIVGATSTIRSLNLAMELKVVGEATMRQLHTMVDSGADGNFLDAKFVKHNNIPTRNLSRPIPVNNVDGSPNKQGPILEVVDAELCYQGHMERVRFAVTDLGDAKMLLGRSWLSAHNPEVDWKTGEVKMTRCFNRCHACVKIARVQCSQAKAQDLKAKTDAGMTQRPVAIQTMRKNEVVKAWKRTTKSASTQTSTPPRRRSVATQTGNAQPRKTTATSKRYAVMEIQHQGMPAPTAMEDQQSSTLAPMPMEVDKEPPAVRRLQTARRRTPLPPKPSSSLPGVHAKVTAVARETAQSTEKARIRVLQVANDARGRACLERGVMSGDAPSNPLATLSLSPSGSHIGAMTRQSPKGPSNNHARQTITDMPWEGSARSLRINTVRRA
jgi:hypothetical protein